LVSHTGLVITDSRTEAVPALLEPTLIFVFSSRYAVWGAGSLRAAYRNVSLAWRLAKPPSESRVASEGNGIHITWLSTASDHNAHGVPAADDITALAHDIAEVGQDQERTTDQHRASTRRSPSPKPPDLIFSG
jgi:hypothetical protein